MKIKKTITMYMPLAMLLSLFLAGTSQAQLVSPEDVIFYTEEWDGERTEDGRPRVSDEILERMKYVSIEEAWATIRGPGYNYNHKFEGNWEIIDPENTMTGRALTVGYVPSSPELQQRMAARGRQMGIQGANMDQWAPGMLNQGDFYVVDAFGKVVDGPVVGDNFANGIYTNSGNGIIFYGAARDLAGQKAIEGYNAWVKEWHPSFIQEMMVENINGIIRVGDAVVLPGDVVLANDAGVIFIPPHLAERVILYSEVTRTTDAFRQSMIRAGEFTLQSSYPNMNQEQYQMMYDWLPDNRDYIHEEHNVAYSTIDHIIEDRSTNYQQWLD